MNVLFDEASVALKEVRVLADEESRKVMSQFVSSFPIRTSGNGGIDWNRLIKKCY